MEISKQIACLQLEIAVAAGRLSRIRKTRNKVSKHHSEAVRRGLQGLEEEDELLGILDSHERYLIQDLQV